MLVYIRTRKFEQETSELLIIIYTLNVMMILIVLNIINVSKLYKL